MTELDPDRQLIFTVEYPTGTRVRVGYVPQRYTINRDTNPSEFGRKVADSVRRATRAQLERSLPIPVGADPVANAAAVTETIAGWFEREYTRAAQRALESR
jgi:hypothetical protein